MRRINCCEVCGRAFIYTDDGAKQTRCRQCRRIDAPGGYYVIITFVDGLSVDQEDFLARMIDRRMTKTMLSEMVITHALDGAIVQHQRTGDFYRVTDGGLIKINCTR